MEKRTKRVRGSNWNLTHTVALAELKRDFSLNKQDGRLVWELIAQTLSGRFPDQIRTGTQCRRRWDTLVKVYNYIEDYCIQTGALDHREVDEDELASMKLDTAYHQDWYDIVDQVCSRRRGFSERCHDRDLVLAKGSKGSSTGSHSVELPEHRSNSYPLRSPSTRKSVTHREQAPIESIAQVSSSPSSEVDKLNPEEETPRFRNYENDAFMFETTQLWQHGQVYHEVSQEPQTLESANQLPYNFPGGNGVQLNEPQYNWWDLIDFEPFEPLAERESYKESELSKPFDPRMVSVGLGVQSIKQLQVHVQNDLPQDPSPRLWKMQKFSPYAWGPPEPECYLANGQMPSLPHDVRAWRPNFGSYAGGREFGPFVKNNWPSAGIKSSSDSVNQDGPIPSATLTSSTSSRSSDSTTSRQSRRWSLKVILLNFLQCCYTCGRK